MNRDILPNQNYANVPSPTEATELDHAIEGVHLGHTMDEDGVRRDFKDSDETLLPDLGFAFIVKQSSTGFTGISAKAIEGFRIQAFTHSVETNTFSWSDPREPSDEVAVSSDNGNLMTTPIKDVVAANFLNISNPGRRGGIVRVTNAGGETRHFALVADFTGEADDWQVTGDVTEVYPRELGRLAASAPESEA